MRDSLAVVLATVLSTDIEGDPLWLYLVGVPSSGKSVFCEALAGSEICECISMFTGMHSGWRKDEDKKKKKRDDEDDNDDDKEDHSLIPIINKKTLVVKDFTTLLRMPPGVQEQVFGELRDLYDGASRVHYRNAVSRKYEDVKFSIVAGVTPKIRNINRSALGERFLHIELIDEEEEDYSHKKHISVAMDNLATRLSRNGEVTGRDARITDQLAAVTIGYLQHKKGQLEAGNYSIPVPNEEQREQLSNLAQFVCLMRSVGEKPDTYKHKPELAIRLSLQFMKLSGCLAFALDEETVTEEVLDIVQRVAMDTCNGFALDLTRLMIDKGKQTIRQLHIRSAIQEQRVRKILDSMRELGIVKRVTTSKKRNILWKVTDDVNELWEGF